MKCGSLVEEMGLCSSIRRYQEEMVVMLAGWSKLRVPQLASTRPLWQYNREWVFRCIALGDARSRGCQRLYYSNEDRIADLPGPDCNKHLTTLERLSRTKYVATLYKRHNVRICPEYISAALCLGHGRYGENVGATQAAQKRLLAGRCAACRRAHRSAAHCRNVLGHTASAPGRHTPGVKRRAL